MHYYNGKERKINTNGSAYPADLPYQPSKSGGILTKMNTVDYTKKGMAKKMKTESKEYKTTRCGSCGKFGHHHSEHNQ